MSAETTFRELCLNFIKSKDTDSANHKTWYVRKKQCEKHLLPIIGDTPIDKLDYPCCIDALNTIKQKGYTDITIGAFLTMIRSVIRYASEQGHISMPFFMTKETAEIFNDLIDIRNNSYTENNVFSCLPEPSKIENVIMTRKTSLLIFLICMFNENQNRAHHKVSWQKIQAIYSIVDEELTNKPLGDFNKYDIDILCHEIITSKYSPAYVRSILYFLRFAFSFAFEKGLINNGFRSNFYIPRIPPHMIFQFTEDEYKTIKEEMSKSQFSNLYTLVDAIGITRGEIAALKLHQYDMNTKSLTIANLSRYDGLNYEVVPLDNCRNFQKRTITLPQIASNAIENEIVLREQKQMLAVNIWDDTDDFLFTDKNGRMIRQDDLSIDIERIKNKTGVASFGLNNLRMHCIHRMIKNRIPVIQIKEYLGYKSLSSIIRLYNAVPQNEKWREEVI